MEVIIRDDLDEQLFREYERYLESIYSMALEGVLADPDEDLEEF